MLGGRYRLVWGQRRFLASRIAGVDTIPAIVVAPDGDLTAPGPRRSIEQLAENLHRRQLNPIEIAEALRDAIAARAGTTQAQIAKSLGITQVEVSRSLLLLELNPAIVEHVRRGRLNVAQARAFRALPVSRQGKMARWAVQGGWTAREIERRVAIALNPVARRAKRGRPPIIELPLAGEHSRSISIPVSSNAGRRVMLTIAAADARLIGRRLLQAFEAVAS